MKINEEVNGVYEKQGLLKNYSVILAALIVVLAGIHSIRTILGPVLLAIFFTILLISPIKWLRSKGISSWLSLTSVIIGIIAAGVVVATLVATQLAQFAENIPEYRDRFNDVLTSYNLGFKIDEFLPEFMRSDDKEQGKSTEGDADENDESSEQTLNVRPEILTNDVGDVVRLVSNVEQAGNPPSSQIVEATTLEITDEGAPENKVQQGEENSETEENESETSETKRNVITAGAAAVADTSSKGLFRFLSGLVAELSYLGSNTFLITLMLIFMLAETTLIPEKLMSVWGEKKFTDSHIQKVLGDIRNYMVIKTWLSVLVAISATLVMIVTKVQYPFLWGLVVFLLEFIPNLGSVVSAIPPVILATIDHGLIVGGIDAICFAAINCIFGYVLEPKLLGNGLNLSPLVVLVSLIFFGWLLGPIGMFLSPVLAVVVKFFFQSFPETLWLAALMSEKPPIRDADDVQVSV